MTEDLWSEFGIVGLSRWVLPAFYLMFAGRVPP